MLRASLRLLFSSPAVFFVYYFSLLLLLVYLLLLCIQILRCSVKCSSSNGRLYALSSTDRVTLISIFSAAPSRSQLPVTPLNPADEGGLSQRGPNWFVVWIDPCVVCIQGTVVIGYLNK